MKKIKIGLLTLFTCMLLACVPANPNLEESEKSWKASGLSSYLFNVKEKCLNCSGSTEEFTQDYYVLVVNGEVNDVISRSGSNPQWAVPIDDIFSDLKDKLTAEEQGQVSFDPNLYYPRDTKLFEIADFLTASEVVNSNPFRYVLSKKVWEEDNTGNYTLTYEALDQLNTNGSSELDEQDRIKFEVIVRNNEIVNAKVLEVNSIAATPEQQSTYEAQATTMDGIYNFRERVINPAIIEYGFDSKTSYLQTFNVTILSGKFEVYYNIEVQFD